MPFEDLKRIAAPVKERRGWDFSRMRDDRDPVPWDYVEVVRRYLQPSHHVLDVGAGGGERFLELAPHFARGVGIDVSEDMTRTARENTPPSLADRITFRGMSGQALEFPDASFDVVLNRHAPIFVDEIARVLRPGGVFITQQVGPRNTHNICSLFGCGPGGEYESDPTQRMDAVAEAFRERDWTVRCWAEYDVLYFICDVESLLFWMKAIPIPEDFNLERHWQQVDQIIAAYHTSRGIQTNEHRELLIVQRQ